MKIVPSVYIGVLTGIYIGGTIVLSQRKDMTEMNLTRKFGVEIEFQSNRERDEVATFLRGKGIEVYAEGYNHITRDYWKIVTDSSCGYELVSPPLSGEDGFAQIEKACAGLLEAGAKVDKSCGLHVHVDARDLSKRALASITATYARFEKFFDSILPESRRDNRYCKGISALLRMNEENKADFAKRPASIFEVAMNFDYAGARYHKVNLEAFALHGTIEFRQHSGTIEAEKIINWVVLMLTLVEVARPAYVNLNAVKVSVSTVKSWLGISARDNDPRIAACSKWIDARFSQFTPGVALTATL